MSDFNIQLDNKAVGELQEAIGGGSGSDNIFIVTVTADFTTEEPSFSQDKSNAEIYQALTEGKLVFVKSDVLDVEDRHLLCQQVLYGYKEVEDETETYTFYTLYNSDQPFKIDFAIKGQRFVILD